MSVSILCDDIPIRIIGIESCMRCTSDDFLLGEAIQGIIGSLFYLAIRIGRHEEILIRIIGIRERGSLVRITSYNVCYTKLLRAEARSGRDHTGRVPAR